MQDIGDDTNITIWIAEQIWIVLAEQIWIDLAVKKVSVISESKDYTKNNFHPCHVYLV